MANPIDEDYALRVDDLILNALAIPGRKARPVVLFQVVLTLQARDLVRAGFFLSKHRHTTASWLCVRSLAELVIRMKWLGKSDSRFWCLIIGEDVDSLRRHLNARKPHRLKRAAIQAINSRLTDFLSKVPKRGPYWDRKNQRFKGTPTVKQMAQKANAITIYNGEFRYSSLHVHSSTRVFTHSELSPRDPRKLMFQIEATRNAEAPPDRQLFTLYLKAVSILQQCGFPIDDHELTRIRTDSWAQQGNR